MLSRRALPRRERYWSGHTEDLNGSVVVKKPHDLVYMGLDVRLCTCTHLVNQESSLVKNTICETYVSTYVMMTRGGSYFFPHLLYSSEAKHLRETQYP